MIVYSLRQGSKQLQHSTRGDGCGDCKLVPFGQEGLVALMWCVFIFDNILLHAPRPSSGSNVPGIAQKGHAAQFSIAHSHKPLSVAFGVNKLGGPSRGDGKQRREESSKRVLTLRPGVTMSRCITVGSFSPVCPLREDEMSIVVCLFLVRVVPW